MKKLLPGQTLVIILLAMVASLTVGLAVSTRTISTLRQTTFTSQAAGALAAAEAGAEEALKRLTDTNDSCAANAENGVGGSCAYSSASKTYTAGSCLASKSFSGAGESGASFSYCVEKGGGSNEYLVDLEGDKTQEIKINKGEAGGYEGTSIKICWYIDGYDRTPAASLEVSVIGSSSLISKHAFNSRRDTASTTNGFTSSSGTPSGSFVNCEDINVSSAKIVRVRSLYNGVSAAVYTGVNSLPFQSYQIESVGSLGGVIKKVRVTKSLPSLPTIFDFGLFSGSETEPIRSQ